MKVKIKKIIAIAISIVLAITSTVTVLAETVSYAPNVPVYDNAFGSRLSAFPSNYKVLNADGKEFTPATASTNLSNIPIDTANLPDDTVALVYYLDLSQASTDGTNYNSNAFQYKVDLNGSNLQKHTTDNLRTLFYGRSLNRAGIVQTAKSDFSIHTDFPWGGYIGSVQNCNKDGYAIVNTGSSGYVIHKFTKAELANVTNFTITRRGGFGSNTSKKTVAVRDIGVLTGADFETAAAQLESAYKTNLNYVITNPYIYTIEADGTFPGAYNKHIPLGTSQSGTSPNAPTGKSLKMVYYFDNTLNDISINMRNDSRISNAVDYSGTKVTKIIDNTTDIIGISSDGIKQETVNYPANSYGYVIIDIPEGNRPEDYTNLRLYISTEREQPLYVGGFGYVVDDEAFKTKLQADLKESYARIEAAKSAIDAIPSSGASGFVSAVSKARNAYNLLDPTPVLSNVAFTARTPEKNILNGYTSDSGKKYIEILEAAEAELESLDFSSYNALAPMPRTYNDNEQSTRLSSVNIPDSYVVTNADGIDSDVFVAYSTNGTKTTVGSVNLGINEDASNLNDVSGIAFYLDTSEAKTITKSNKNNLLMRISLTYEDKSVAIIGNTVNQYYLANKSTTFYSDKGTGSGSGSYGKNSFSSSAKNGFKAGYSQYVAINITQEELNAAFETLGVTDYTKVNIDLRNAEWLYGGDMIGSRAYVRDVGFLTGDFDTACSALEDAYKKQMNYVPTSGTLYHYSADVNSSTSEYGKSNGMVYTYLNDAVANDGDNNTIVVYFDNTNNTTDAEIWLRSNETGNPSVEQFKNYSPRVIYVDKNGNYCESTDCVKNSHLISPANSYGYFIFTVPDADVKNLLVTRIPVKNITNRIVIGGYGYVYDIELFELVFKSQIAKSAERVAAAKNAIEAIPDSSNAGYTAALIDAFEAYDALDGYRDFSALGSEFSCFMPERNMLVANTSAEAVTAYETAINGIIDDVQAKVDALETITPASEIDIIVAQEAYDALSDAAKAKITNVDYLTTATDKFDAFRPSFVGTHYTNEFSENNEGIRFVSKMGTLYSGTDFTLSEYGAVIGYEEKFTSSDFVVSAENTVNTNIELTDTLSADRNNHFGASVIVAAKNQDKEILFRPYVVYTDAENNKYFVYAKNVKSAVFSLATGYNDKVNDRYFGYYHLHNDEYATNYMMSDNCNVIVYGRECINHLPKLSRYNTKVWMNITDYIYRPIVDAQTTGSTDWQENFDKLNQSIIATGAEDALLGWYLDEPSNMAALKTISEYAQKYGRRFFVCFDVQTVSPRSYGSDKGEGWHTSREYTQYLTDVAFDCYWGVEENKQMFNNIIEDMHNTCPEDAYVWYIPGTYTGNDLSEYSDEELQEICNKYMKNVNALYNFLLAEKNPGGLICFTNDFITNTRNLYGIRQMMEQTNGRMQPLVDGLAELGREICTTEYN